jgi:phosphoribosylamine--glycine ligase
MNILVVGSGGREHALCAKIAKSPLTDKLFCAPGNAGIRSVATCVDISANNIEKLKQFALENNIDLTVVGPEQPLVEGIVDEFEKEGLVIFGPAKSGAVLEGSKVFAKDFMEKHGIKTAKYKVFSCLKDARAFLESEEMPCPFVIKADGLAAGKGVIICENVVQGMDAINAIMDKKEFGEAGNKIVLEEFLRGKEASVHIITDGENYVILPPAKDHKKIYEGEKGLNTGGMGAVSPAPYVDNNKMKEVEENIIKPFMKGIKADNIKFKGVLFFGLMLNSEGIYVLEFNVRFGDPETEVLMPLIENDIVPILYSSAKGKLSDNLKIKKLTAVNVVAVSKGYPKSYKKGFEIFFNDNLQGDTVVYHAGTAFVNGKTVTSGGRVLSVTALGETIKEAREKAYNGISTISYEGMYFRKDIAK